MINDVDISSHSGKTKQVFPCDNLKNIKILKLSIYVTVIVRYHLFEQFKLKVENEKTSILKGFKLDYMKK